jgi:hypothetical protein
MAASAALARPARRAIARPALPPVRFGVGSGQRVDSLVALVGGIQSVGVASPFKPSLPRSSPKDRRALLIGPRRSRRAL